MLSALASLKTLIKLKSYHIDHPLFRLHYQVTVSALLAFCLILTAKILFGDTIDCQSRILGRDDFFDNLCYSQGTKTTYAIDESTASHVAESVPITTGEHLKQHFRLIHRLVKSDRNEHNYSSDIRYIHSGIMIPREDIEVHSATYWHRYYQYIPIILFLQAAFFYLPHYLWKTWENGIVSSVCKQLHENRFAPTEYIESNYHMIDYLQNCFNLNKCLVYKYFFCHALLLVNLIGQIITLNVIFNNQYITYGMDVFQYLFIDNDIYGLRGNKPNMTEINSPMDFVFPKFTACEVSLLSEAGKRPDTYSFLCILPLNILYDKFFLILWFWFLVLAFFTVLQIVYDTLYTAMPMLRKHLFKRRYGPYLSEDNRHSSSLSELFLLDLIGSNSDKFAFSVLLRKLNKEDWQSSPSENQSLV